MNIVNDNTCSWLNDLDRRSNIKTLDKDKSCDWLIVGAGYTGLSAARKSATKKLRLPGKLTDCSNNIREGTELFIVEGDSAKSQ